MRTVIGGLLAAGLIASPAFAQSSTGTWNDLPDRFQIDTGYFRLTADTVLRYNGPQGGSGEVDFEQDLGLDEQVNTFWVDATWRVGRRHQLKLGFTRINRERGDYTLQRDFTWGGETYSAGLNATSTTGSDILGGYYRFAIVRNDASNRPHPRRRLPVAGREYPARSGPQSRTLTRRDTGSITGAVGGHASAWPTKRLALRGDLLYIKVSLGKSEEASVTDWRLAADYYFFRNAGLGVQYKYNRYTDDRGILSRELGGEITFKGFQVFLSFLF
jgi:hypothetical protein